VTSELAEYIENIRYTSKIHPADEAEIIGELENHIEDKLQELTESGLSEEEAIRTCLHQLGSPALVARQIYEAYSQGSWKQVFMASLPHVLFGALFTLNWWSHIGWLVITLCLVSGITIYGWCHGKPTWVFSWLSYSLLPVLAVGILLVYLPKGVSLLAIPVYIPLASWWLIHLVIQTVKKDWLFTSVMLLPMPIIIGWFQAILPDWKITEYSLERATLMAPWIGLSFLALALTIAAFIRIRQRWLRIGVLVLSGVITLTLVVYYAYGRINTPMFVGLMLVMWGVFLVPLLLERRFRNKNKLLLKDSGVGTNKVV
jgi:hypothetical protein